MMIPVASSSKLQASLLKVSTLLLLVATFIAADGRIRGENGEISLTIAVPLTSNNVKVHDPGWYLMVAALLAVEHFNARDPAVVPELAALGDCKVRFGTVTVVDTGTNSHQAMKAMLQSTQDQGPPDAIVGPFNEQPALELSVMATGLESPLVAIRGVDHNLILPDKHPFYSQINPDLYGQMDFLGAYLKHRGRTNYIAIVYSSVDSVLQRIEILRGVLRDNVGVDQIKAYGYQSADKTYGDDNTTDRGIREAIWKAKQTGFRTILLFTPNPDTDTPEVGRAAHEFGLDQGGHFWILPGGLDPSSTEKNNILRDHRGTPVGGFLRGAAFTYVYDGFMVDPTDKLIGSLSQQNASFVQKVKDLNPIPNYLVEEYFGVNFTKTQSDSFPPGNLFQILAGGVSDGASFAYDAAMSVGIGACLVTANTTDTVMTGETHLEGIRSVDFRGASGQVMFRNLPGTPGSRMGRSAYFGVLNLLSHGADTADRDLVTGTDFLDPETNEWVVLTPFVYSDGTTHPPALLRSVPEQNYLDTKVRATGLALMSIALFVIMISAIWVVLHRNHNVVIAAQPLSLYVLCLGSTITSLVILISSFDESYGWSDSMLDMACVSLPWLLALGHIITYSALFTKLWRVQKVLSFKKARIKVSQVMWPSLVLVGIAVVILSVWTAVGNFGWERTETDSLTGESIGRCQGSNTLYFLVPVAIICFIPTLLTGTMAWKTNDVDNIYSDSKWMCSLILVQIQVIIVGVPIVVILNDVSTTGRYIGLSLLVWTFPMTTMGIMMVPKVLAVRREQSGARVASVIRGSKPRIKISGVGFDATSSETQQPYQEPSSNIDTESPTPAVFGGAQNIQTVTFQ